MKDAMATCIFSSNADEDERIHLIAFFWRENRTEWENGAN